MIAAARPAPKPSPPTPPEPGSSRPAEPKLRAELRRALASIRSEYISRTPDQAAQAWLRLVDRYAAFARKYGAEGGHADDSYYDKNKFGFEQVLKALPPPSAWRALAVRIEARKAPAASLFEGSLRLLAHLLTDDVDRQWKDVAALERVSMDGSLKAEENVALVVKMHRALADRSGDPARILQAMERTRLLPLSHNRLHTLELPDLLSMIGPQKAEVVLKRALRTPTLSLSVVKGADATLKRARRLALALGPQVKTPSWGLVMSIDADSMRLFESFERQALALGGGKSMGRYEGEFPDNYDSAKFYHLMGLIAAGRGPQAARVNLARQAWNGWRPDEAVEALIQQGGSAALSDFLHSKLSADPGQQCWDRYIEVASRIHQMDRVIALLRSFLTKPGLELDLQQTLRGHLIQALLAADRVEDGVREIRTALIPPDPARERTLQRLYAAEKLTRLGHLLYNRSWEEEGIRGAVAFSAAGMKLVDLYHTLGRGLEEERALVGILVNNERPDRIVVTHAIENDTQFLLIRLLSVYNRAGRTKDVLLLLDRASGWQVKDLSSIYLEREHYGDGHFVGWMVARALAATGRAAEAAPILKAILYRNMDYDPAYQLLIDLQGVAAIPFLDHLAATDRFEERPLIWKAYAYYKAKRLIEAERTARAAIAIDPSDGEQEEGRRLRVYSILADIRAARGDSDQAALYRKVVRAIRIAEDADDLAEVGLRDRSLRRYEEALGLFADAYCIQSRLAVKLAEEGRLQEAEAHYRRAYELMPDSFGRMESHCFGCERVFEGARATGIAERVFKRMLAKSPHKPQLHYLLGYLREQQGHRAEAAAHYRQAARLDPDYINAWKHLADLESQTGVRARESDTIIFQLLRLDPQQKHNTTDLDSVNDLATLWRTLEAARSSQPPIAPGRMLPLTASKQRIEQYEAERRAEDPDYDPEEFRRPGRIWDRFYWQRKLGTPGESLAQYSILQELVPIVQAAFP